MLLLDVKNWSDAFTISGLGILIVFIVLILLVFLLIGFGKIFEQKSNSDESCPINITPTSNADESDDNERAAIAMALYLFYADVHDEESYVITIENRQPSAWNSKIYNSNNML